MFGCETAYGKELGEPLHLQDIIDHWLGVAS